MSKVFVRDIIAHTATAFGVRGDEIKSPCRLRILAYPRFAVYLMAKQLTDLPYLHIGRLMGRDHSTVIYGARRARHLLLTNDEFRDRYLAAEEAVVMSKPLLIEPIEPPKRQFTVAPATPAQVNRFALVAKNYDECDALSQAVAAHYASAA